MGALRKTLEMLREMSKLASESVGEDVIVSVRPLLIDGGPQFDFLWFENNELKRTTVGLSLTEIERVRATVVQMAMGRFHLQIGAKGLGDDGELRVG